MFGLPLVELDERPASTGPGALWLTESQLQGHGQVGRSVGSR